jgi:hypothetical protein
MGYNGNETCYNKNNIGELSMGNTTIGLVNAVTQSYWNDVIEELYLNVPEICDIFCPDTIDRARELLVTFAEELGLDNPSHNF